MFLSQLQQYFTADDMQPQVDNTHIDEHDIERQFCRIAGTCTPGKHDL